MGLYVRNVLGKDLASIVGGYCLPNRDKMKNLYSSIVTPKYNMIFSKYEISSIESQYNYFKLRKIHGKYKSIAKGNYSSHYMIRYNIPNCFQVQDELYSSYDIDTIRSYISSQPDYVLLYIKLENITYSDIIKCKDKNIQKLWFEKKRKV